MRAHEPASLAGKRDTRHHSATGFSENVLVAETSYQMLKFYHIANGKGLLKFPLIKVTVLTILRKKNSMKLSGVSIF